MEPVEDFLLLLVICTVYIIFLKILDVWLTVHRNSVWIRNQLDVTFV